MSDFTKPEQFQQFMREFLNDPTFIYNEEIANPSVSGTTLKYDDLQSFVSESVVLCEVDRVIIAVLPGVYSNIRRKITQMKEKMLEHPTGDITAESDNLIFTNAIDMFLVGLVIGHRATIAKHGLNNLEDMK